MELGQLSFNHKMRARAAIDIYKGKNNRTYSKALIVDEMRHIVSGIR